MRSTLAASLAVLLPLTALGRTPVPPGGKGRSVVLASHGMVAASHPLAAQAGLQVLRDGGNAVDAAIAANAVLGVVEPMSCGVGGDLFAIVWDAKSKRLYGLNASGRAPLKATRQLFADRGLAAIPTDGPLSWSVPGCVDGWDELRRKFGSKSFAETLKPAIACAEDGFPVPEVIAGYWQAAEAKLTADDGSASVFLLPEGTGRRSPRAGEVVKNPALARTLRDIADGGRDAFYTGRIARELVAFSDKQGGLFAAKDLADHRSEWVTPASVPYRGYEVCALPPPGQGLAVLQMLRVLEGYDLARLGPASPDYWHLLIEAKKLAYADRAKFYADPAFARVPVAGLIDAGYADRRRKLIDPDKALTDVEPGDPKLGQADTVYLCAVDKDGNCVSLIQSNYFGFGSGRTPAALGFPLQNRGTLFALDEKHANRLEPGKRPFHTIIPGFALKDGKPWLVFGVMGGDMQPQGQVQALVNIIDFGMDVQAAGECPRIEHVGSARPTGEPGDRDGGTVLVEAGMPTAVEEGLRRKGHAVRRVAVNGGGYQAILIDPKSGVLHGGSEARKDGHTVGY